MQQKRLSIYLIMCIGFLVSLILGSCQSEETDTPLDESDLRTQAAETVIAGIVETGVAGALPVEFTQTPPRVEPTETLEVFINSSESKNSLRAEIEQVLGQNNRGLPVLTEFDVGELDGGALYITWPLDDNTSSSLIKQGAKTDTANILKAITQNNINYQYAVLSGTFPIKDEEGIFNEETVINLLYNKASVDQINWDDFQIGNIYITAEEAYLHDTFLGD